MAISIDIQGNLNVDTSQAKSQIQSLANQTVQPSLVGQNTPPINNGSDLDTPIDTESQTLDENKKSNDLLKNIYSTLQSQSTQNMFSTKEHKPISYGGFNNAIGNGENTLRQIINYDFIGATRGGLTTTGRALQQGATTISKEKEGLGSSVLSTLLGTLGTAGIVAGAILGVGGAVGNKVMGEYEKNLPSMEDLYRAYGGDISSGSQTTNSLKALTMAHTIQPFSEGTGLTNAEFMAQASEYAKYGVSDVITASQSTRGAINMSRLTGTDFDEIQRLQGMNYRFNGVDGESTINQLYQQASRNGVTIEDLQKYLPELISSVSTAMEEGVNKGFTRSVSDVADSISFISNLSDNEAWKKTAGQTFSSMNHGLADAVNLNSTSDIIAFQSISNMSEEDRIKALGGMSTGNSYLDKALILENGATPELVKAIHSQVQNTYGEGDILSGVMTYKDMYGLNTKGAVTLYQALNSGLSGEALDTKIQELTSDSQYKNDSTKMTDILNDINDKVQDAGKTVYDIKANAISFGDDVLDGIHNITSLLGMDPYSDLVGNYSGLIFTDKQKEEKNLRESFEKNMKEGLANPSTTGTYQEILNYMEMLGAGKLQTANLTDIFNNIDWSNGEEALKQLMAIGGEKGNNILTTKAQQKTTLISTENAIESIRNSKKYTSDQKKGFIDELLDPLTYATITTDKYGHNETSNNYVDKLEYLGNNIDNIKTVTQIEIHLSKLVDFANELKNNFAGGLVIEPY